MTPISRNRLNWTKITAQLANSAARLSRSLRGQQPLHEQLLGSVTGGCQEAPADQARPKRVTAGKIRRRQLETEVEHAQLAERRGHGNHVRPPSRYLMQEDHEADRRAENVEEHLRHVGPDHRCHAAFEGVEQRQADDQHDGGDLAGAQHDRNHDRDGEDAHALGESANDQKRRCGHPAQAGAEPDFDELVGREHFAPEILGQKEERNHDARQQVPQDHLQEAEVAGEGQARGADDGQRAGLGGYDGERDGPPRSGPAAEEVLLQALLAPAKMGAEPGYPGQVDEDDGPISVAHSSQDSRIQLGGRWQWDRPPACRP